MLSTFLTLGLTLGISAGFSPGPTQTYQFSQTLRRGWQKTWYLSLVPIVSDAPISISLYLLLSQLPAFFITVLRIIGGLFILFLAWNAYKSFQKMTEPIARIKGTQTDEQNPVSDRMFLKAAMMNLLNPNVYIFWGTVGVPKVIEGLAISPWYAAAFILGFYLTLIPVMALSIILFGTSKMLPGNVQRWIGFGLAMMLAGMGLYNIWQGVSTLL